MRNVFTASNGLTSLKTPRICRKWLTIIAMLFGSGLAVAQATSAVLGPESSDVRSSADPQDFGRAFLGTSAGELYLSTDGSHNLLSHRKISTVFADRAHPNTIYAAVDDNGLGGVLVTHDGGTHWQQMNAGLAGHDIFSLAQSSRGDLLAGTQRGVYVYNHQTGRWCPSNLVVNEKIISVASRTAKLKNATLTTRKEYVRAELKGRVARVIVSGERLYAATSDGVYASYDQGHSRHGGPVGDQRRFDSIDANGEKVAASAPNALAISNKHGERWTLVSTPSFGGTIFNVAVSPSAIWISTDAGVFCSHDDGASWENVLVGTPQQNLVAARYDSTNQRMLGVTKTSGVYVMSDGLTWTNVAAADMQVRYFSIAGERIMAVKTSRGIIAQPSK